MDISKRLIKVSKKYLKKQSQEDISHALVAVFLHKNALDFSNFPHLKAIVSKSKLEIEDILKTKFFKDGESFELQDLICCFEALVPLLDKKAQGIVYTPYAIKAYIIAKVLGERDCVPNLCDPACGCGSFLITAAEILSRRFKVSIQNLIENHLYGVDLDKRSILRTKVLFELLLCMHHEKPARRDHLYCADTLDRNTFKRLKRECPKLFDCVVGNPPYVRARNLTPQTLELIANYECAGSGIPDLYIPFFEVGLNLLNQEGVLSYISPNSFMQSVNGRALRNFFKNKRVSVEILDFRDCQIFKNVTSYTCITSVVKQGKSQIKYARALDCDKLTNSAFTHYRMEDFPDNKPWRLCDFEHDHVIHKLENAGISLASFKIRNGLATLKNDVFFFIPEAEDQDYYYLKNHKLEKELCIDIVKPNTVKSEEALALNREKALFPYIKEKEIFVALEEQYLQEHYPCAYAYLLSFKEELLQRDKGKRRNYQWYAYGRNQGLQNYGKKLLIPYISDAPVAVLSLDESLQFYCGYALFADDIDTLKVLKCFLESDAFWYYIRHTSKPYTKGFMALAKNYITLFSIPNLNQEERKSLLDEDDKKRQQELIWKLYGIEGEQIPKD